MEEPKVTVFIPTYNRLSMLKNAVKSVISQGVRCRLHVLDNNSDDGSREWLEALDDSVVEITLTLRDENVGANRNYEEGFLAVKTSYLIPLADDDELAPGFLSKALEFASSNESRLPIIFKTEVVTEDGGRTVSPVELDHGKTRIKEHLYFWAKCGHYVSWSSILWPTDVVRNYIDLENIGRFGIPSDIWFQFSVFLRCDVYLADEIGSVFRVHPEQVSSVRAKVDLLEEYTELGREIRDVIGADERWNDEEREEVLSLLWKGWNRGLRFALMRACAPVSKEELIAAYNRYGEMAVEYVGLDEYPLVNYCDVFTEQAGMQAREIAVLRQHVEDLGVQLHNCSDALSDCSSELSACESKLAAVSAVKEDEVKRRRDLEMATKPFRGVPGGSLTARIAGFGARVSWRLEGFCRGVIKRFSGSNLG